MLNTSADCNEGDVEGIVSIISRSESFRMTDLKIAFAWTGDALTRIEYLSSGISKQNVEISVH